MLADIFWKKLLKVNERLCNVAISPTVVRPGRPVERLSVRCLGLATTTSPSVTSDTPLPHAVFKCLFRWERGVTPGPPGAENSDQWILVKPREVRRSDHGVNKIVESQSGHKMAKILNKEPAVYRQEQDNFLRELRKFHDNKGWVCPEFWLCCTWEVRERCEWTDRM